MALKLTIQFPIFAPPPNHHNNHRKPPLHHRPPTEIRFSRWNNANAEPFELKRRQQEQIEHDIRRRRRFDSADNIAATATATATSRDSSPTTTTSRDTTATTFKSTGTPSSPSKSSIPSKNSKYSKNPNANSHPVFRKKPKVISRSTNRNGDVFKRNADVSNVTVTEDGVSYIVKGAPFEMMYSYTETPKVKPIALREPPFSPFGPPTMARPWTGKAPLPGSKKKLREFDSFVLPPPFKKGVKPVQRPGPFLQGSGPKYVKSREEILGEALTEEEVKGLIQSCMKSDRQLNMGRDGLTHNMLDNIHAHWKRRRVCKIKCKGVCTVDMANVRTQLEEKTGGKIIHSRGGVLFLFRGRNYNYLTRPRYPIMLWKPATPVYPRLIKQAPEGLTLEEAGIMRKKGRDLIPICKLAKNGVYSELANNVREAFEACELARINCQGLNPSDYRRIGAKLKDLVPCVLISFEHEHILMWRGREWKSSFSDQGGLTVSIAPTLEKQEVSESPIPNISVVHTDIEVLNTSTLMNSEIAHEELVDDLSSEDIDPAVNLVEDDFVGEIIESGESFELDTVTEDTLRNIPEVSQDTISEPTELSTPCTEGVLLLLKHALESGSACILDGAPLDDDDVYKRVVEFSPSAPAGPVFKYRPRRTKVQKWEKGENKDSKDKQDSTVSEKILGVKIFEEDIIVQEIKYVPEKRAKKSPRSKKMSDFNGDYPNAVPKGTLGVDELAKLLS